MKRPKSHYKISVVESPNSYIVFKKRTPLCRPQHPYDGKWNASMKPTCEECRRRLKQISKYKDAIGYTFHTQTTFAF